ncbi:MAG: prepilin peptidase [Pseudomonadota bacterium]
MLQPPALWVAFAAMLPLMAYTAWSDIRYLKIPNWVPVAAVVVFLVTGLWGLPLDRVLWGLAAGAVTLIVFFLLWALADSFSPGNLGAGDVKLIAALVPFVDLADAAQTLVLFTVLVILLAVVFLMVWAMTRRRTGYASLDQSGKKVRKLTSPFGVALALTAVLYLGLKTWDSLA